MENHKTHFYFPGMHTGLQVSVHNGKIEVTSGYSMVYKERVLNNYFIPCHRTYHGQHNQCHISTAHGGKVACNVQLSCILLLLFSTA